MSRGSNFLNDMLNNLLDFFNTVSDMWNSGDAREILIEVFNYSIERRDFYEAKALEVGDNYGKYEDASKLYVEYTVKRTVYDTVADKIKGGRNIKDIIEACTIEIGDVDESIAEIAEDEAWKDIYGKIQSLKRQS